MFSRRGADLEEDSNGADETLVVFESRQCGDVVRATWHSPRPTPLSIWLGLGSQPKDHRLGPVQSEVGERGTTGKPGFLMGYSWTY